MFCPDERSLDCRCAVGLAVRIFWDDVRDCESTCFPVSWEDSAVSLMDAENRGLYEKKGQEKTYKLVFMSGSENRPDD